MTSKVLHPVVLAALVSLSTAPVFASAPPEKFEDCEALTKFAESVNDAPKLTRPKGSPGFDINICYHPKRTKGSSESAAWYVVRRQVDGKTVEDAQLVRKDGNFEDILQVRYQYAGPHAFMTNLGAERGSTTLITVFNPSTQQLKSQVYLVPSGEQELVFKAVPVKDSGVRLTVIEATLSEDGQTPPRCTKSTYVLNPFEDQSLANSDWEKAWEQGLSKFRQGKTVPVKCPKSV
ncbi:hypothetical protein JRI60_25680 [Archangium violaceum]|uniref:hypothetical protein n=1 Tax=Archangium violaceum TaxID=83451 RepID=UPI00194E63C2|nr:hypothetical protein [Archangium violaceum]QRO02161.1 hypothetical protein JRI60_25680 [Archangium violaceum]